MNDEQRLAELRELFLSAPEVGSTRFVAIALSTALVLAVLWLVRGRRLRAEYTPIWMIVALGIFVASLNLDVLRVVTRAIGAWTTSSSLFFLGQIFLLAICLNYAVRLSKATLQIKNLAQEMALLRARLDAVEVREPSHRGGEV
jgi:hypothetical protein